MKTLVLANHKGGVGKSAVATLMAQYSVRLGHRVLAIDLDHQGNFSKTLTLSGRAQLVPGTASQIMTGPTMQMQPASLALLAADPALLGLERQLQRHNEFARNLRSFLQDVARHFDVCIIDTNPNPDIRLISALASASAALSPIQLNQEALDGVVALLNHPTVGIRKIRTVLNPKLNVIGLLPTLVESTPYQRANFVQVAQHYGPMLIRLSERPGHFAHLPKRSSIAEAQGDGQVLWDMKKTAARDAWREIEPSLARVSQLLMVPATRAMAAPVTVRAAEGQAISPGAV